MIFTVGLKDSINPIPIIKTLLYSPKITTYLAKCIFLNGCLFLGSFGLLALVQYFLNDKLVSKLMDMPDYCNRSLRYIMCSGSHRCMEFAFSLILYGIMRSVNNSITRTRRILQTKIKKSKRTHLYQGTLSYNQNKKPKISFYIELSPQKYIGSFYSWSISSKQPSYTPFPLLAQSSRSFC